MSADHVSLVSEDRLLDMFWWLKDGQDRLGLLRMFAGVQLHRPSDWDEKAIRSEAHVTLTAAGCFACRSQDRRLSWHHVIQVQHGGSNTPRNLVPLCHRCHQRIHPWLEDATSLENRRGWTWVGDWARSVKKRWQKFSEAKAER